jgi:hypothetical protein
MFSEPDLVGGLLIAPIGKLLHGSPHGFVVLQANRPDQNVAGII